jgi:hypothetical protein
MSDKTYEDEVGKRLARWFKMRRVYLVWFAVFNVVAFFTLYGYSYIVVGKEYAMQNAFQKIFDLLGYECVIGLGYLVYLAFYEIPAEIYNEQKKVIEENLPVQLALDLEKGTDKFSKDNVEINIASLFVTSKEKKKIIELQALVNFEHFYYSTERDFVLQAGYHMFLPLYWNGNELEEKIEMRPETPRLLLVSEIAKFKSGKNKSIYLTMFGGSNAVYSNDFGKESIFHVKITFQGKLEGEHNFKTKHCDYYLYTKADEKRILLSQDFSVFGKTYSDIPKKLLDRSLQSIKYLKATAT